MVAAQTLYQIANDEIRHCITVYLIPNTTKNLPYGIAGIMPIFCRASTIKFL